MTGEWAWPSGSDAGRLSREIARAHDDFVTTGLVGGGVRPLVARSWQRAVAGGVDPEATLAPVRRTDEALEAWRQGHPLARVMPVVRRLLVEDAVDAGLLVAVSDAAGRLLWVEGDSSLRSRAEGMHFLAGADWAEDVAGTNAPGTAVALDRAVQIFGAEHLARPATAWSCSAAPIHDPDTGAVLGALDVTGGDDVASPRSLTLVRATVAAVESELRLLRLTGADGLRGRGAPSGEVLLRVLGAPRGVLERDDATTRLSLRHSELLCLLEAAPDGVTAEQLAVELHEADAAPVTVRAELSRLRPLLDGVELLSRPYRVAGGLVSDAALVRSALDAGQYRRAVELYRGPLLPDSDAPGVRRLRDDLHGRVRRALLASGDPDALLRFADTDHGRPDVGVWEAAARALPLGSPRRGDIRMHLELLDRELR